MLPDDVVYWAEDGGDCYEEEEEDRGDDGGDDGGDGDGDGDGGRQR